MAVAALMEGRPDATRCGRAVAAVGRGAGGDVIHRARAGGMGGVCSPASQISITPECRY